MSDDEKPRGEPNLPLMFPRRGVVIPDLPAPARYRDMTPAGHARPLDDAPARRFWRRRLLIALLIAAVLHLLVAFVWWISPPLRLKVGYSADRWVQIFSLPHEARPAAPPSATPPTAAPPSAAPTLPKKSAPAAPH